MSKKNIFDLAAEKISGVFTNPTKQQIEMLELKAKYYKEKGKALPKTVQKPVSLMRNDIKSWKQAFQASVRPEDPKNDLIQALFERTMEDGLLTSQIENRRTKLFSIDWNLVNSKGEIDEDATKELKDAGVYRTLTKHASNALYYGYSLVELDIVKDLDGKDKLNIELIDRQHVTPQNGRFYPDLHKEEFIEYRELREFGNFILEFQSDEYALINKAVKHVLMKDFAQSCWAELCEIYGIPPRFMKTDTQNKQLLNRAEAMMRDMGAAAWFIIDENEEFQFAEGVSSSGDVYNELMKVCNNENSMLVSGAIIAQDTKNGNRSKDESAQDVLWEKVMEDVVISQDHWNKIILPALVRIGFIPEGYTLEYVIPEDLESLWQKVIALMAYADVNLEWVEEKFGIEIDGKREMPSLLKADDGLFL